MAKTLAISIGSNLGNRLLYLREGVRCLSARFGAPTVMSGVYETEAVGVSDHPAYLNAALLFEFSGTPGEALAHTLAVEQVFGRKRTDEGPLPRNLDVDILILGNEIIDSPCLTIPHPRMHLRRFVLVPLAEIAPALVHPLLKQNIQNLLLSCPDLGEVVRINEILSYK